MSPHVMALLVWRFCGPHSSTAEGHFYLMSIFVLIFSGFIKFLGPYYMLLITKRRQIGDICGHTIYAISKSEIIPLPSSSVQSKMANYKSEYRLCYLYNVVIFFTLELLPCYNLFVVIAIYHLIADVFFYLFIYEIFSWSGITKLCG